jgi:cyclopropane-fatty-acyl-phospholipid synthase
MRVRVWVFGILLAAGVFTGLRDGPGRFLAFFAGGLLAWTMIEYLLHRLAFHGFAPHSEHHADPTDPVYIVAPLSLSLSSTAVLLAAFSLATRSFAGGTSVVAGVIAGYLGYEAIHLRIHSPAAGGALLRSLRKHHYYHHFASDQVCYGVTSPLWDWVFRSLPSTSAADSTARSRLA